jgi:hypothetical protein
MVIEDGQGLPRPVCSTHWDDLRWFVAPIGMPRTPPAGARS